MRSLQRWKLAIPKCVMAGVTIVNDTGGTLYINLNGPASLISPWGRVKRRSASSKGNIIIPCPALRVKTGVINLKKGDVWRWWCY